MRMKKNAQLLYLMILGFAFSFETGPGVAQINPFKSNRNGPSLSATDQDLLVASVDRLNRTPNAADAKEGWSNPATGSHGTSTITREFRSAGHPCHAVHHEFYPQGSTAMRNYDLTWCRTPNGQWKIKS